MPTTKSAEEAAAALENGESVLFYSGLLDSEKSVEGFFATNFGLTTCCDSFGKYF